MLVSQILLTIFASRTLTLNPLANMCGMIRYMLLDPVTTNLTH